VSADPNLPQSDAPAAAAPLRPRPRAAIERLAAYVPGEQPRIEGLIKLNTNENPYPPAPEAIAAGRKAAGDSLRVYPDPHSTALREEVASQTGVRPDQVIFANGSDEILRMICTAYLDPGDEAASLWPTYSLYDTLVEIAGGRIRHWPVEPDGPLPAPPAGEAPPRVFFLANPNPPWGTVYPAAQIEKLGRSMLETLLVLDEAYVDFAPDGDGLALLRRLPNLILTRTMSKSYALAGLRLGWAIARPEVIAVLNKVKDSYNVDRVAQAVGLAALQAREYYRERSREVIGQRERLAAELRGLGFDVPRSGGNFLFARRGPVDSERYFTALRERKILVRRFNTPELRDGVRISIGTAAQMDRLIEATKEILSARNG